ncbi:coiled-coil domain-containing protein 81-like isoform 2-T5 [Amazona ochrocephala]
MAVDIGIGTFALVLVHAKVGEDKVLPVERPVFQLCRFMKKFYKLQCAKTKIPKETPFCQLDFQQIGADIHFRPEIVEQCIHETLLFFAGAIQDKREVEFSFRSVGILAVRRSVVSMTFFDNCLLELDTTGNMHTALLGGPCCYVSEDPYCPPHLRRKAYAEELKERLYEKEVLQEERCQSAARQTAFKGQAELHLLGRAWGGKQEKRRLLERQWKAQGLPVIPRSCQLSCCTTDTPAAGTLVITAATTVSRIPSHKGERAK